MRAEYNCEGGLSASDLKKELFQKGTRYVRVKEEQAEGRLYSSYTREDLPTPNNRDLKKAVYARIKEEQMKRRLYPLYTTEQVILAFFVQHFNTKKEIYELMTALGSEFVTQSFANNPEDVWTSANVSNYSDPLDLDYVFIQAYHDLQAPIPFANGQTPRANVLCPNVDADGNIQSGLPFPDCNETLLRHIANIAFFNPSTQTFVIPEQIQNPRLRAFFNTQTPSRVHDASRAMSVLWNGVVSHKPGVRYLQSGNEMDGGIRNLIQALRAIIGYRTAEILPTSQKGIEEEIKLLLMHMNPTFKEVQVKNNGLDQINHNGSIDVTITNAFDATFSFTIGEKQTRSDNGRIHNEMGAPRWKGKETKKVALKTGDPMLDLVGGSIAKEGLYALFARGELHNEMALLGFIEGYMEHITSIEAPIVSRMLLSKNFMGDNIFVRLKATEVCDKLKQKGYCLESVFELAYQAMMNIPTSEDPQHRLATYLPQYSALETLMEMAPKWKHSPKILWAAMAGIVNTKTRSGALDLLRNLLGETFNPPATVTEVSDLYNAFWEMDTKHEKVFDIASALVLSDNIPIKGMGMALYGFIVEKGSTRFQEVADVAIRAIEQRVEVSSAFDLIVKLTRRGYKPMTFIPLAMKKAEKNVAVAAEVFQALFFDGDTGLTDGLYSKEDINSLKIEDLCRALLKVGDQTISLKANELAQQAAQKVIDTPTPSDPKEVKLLDFRKKQASKFLEEINSSRKTDQSVK